MDYKEKVIALLNSQELSKEQKEKLENIFPELKENGDERIRKALIDYFDDAIKADENPLHGIQTHEVINWLERQGEKRPTENVEKKFCEGDKVVSNQDGKVYIVGTEYFIRGDNICLHEIDGYHKWTNRDDLNKNYHLWTSEETDPRIGCTNDKGCVTCDNGNLKEIKIEPKFKVGDWVVRGKTIIQISDIQGQYYIGIDMYGNNLTSRSDKIHLWTIQDAKDGDVLAYATDEGDSWIMIYRSLYEPYEGHVHYHALLVNDDFSDKGTCCICINNLKPATKEQRDLLFQKMKEAGYEWDTNNKELKKMIESKKLDAAEVIEWLGHCNLSNCDMRISTIPDSSPTFTPHLVSRLSDDFINKFKIYFGL